MIRLVQGFQSRCCVFFQNAQYQNAFHQNAFFPNYLIRSIFPNIGQNANVQNRIFPELGCTWFYSKKNILSFLINNHCYLGVVLFCLLMFKHGFLVLMYQNWCQNIDWKMNCKIETWITQVSLVKVKISIHICVFWRC